MIFSKDSLLQGNKNTFNYFNYDGTATYNINGQGFTRLTRIPKLSLVFGYADALDCRIKTYS